MPSRLDRLDRLDRLAADERDHPTPEFIAGLATRFPTDPDLEVALERKLQHRADGPWQPVSVAELSACLDRMLTDAIGTDFTVSGQRWFTGGASKMQLGFVLDWRGPSAGERRRDAMILRMDPSEPLNATSKSREFDIVKAVAGVVPVPTPFWVDADGDWFPGPSVIYGIVPGVTKPATSQSGRVVGLGTNFGPQLRPVLAQQFVDNLAAIHACDVDGIGLGGMTAPTVETNENALWRLNYERRVWEEDRGEECPVLDLAAAWLERNAPTLDRVSVVHGDYRTGNYLFTEDDGQMTAILDWEGGHIGDRHEDLAYTLNTLFGSADEDGRFLTQSLLPEDEFIAAYEAASGLPVVPERLRFWQVYTGVKTLAITPGTAYRISSGKQTHQDVLVAWLCGVEGALAGSLRAMLTEVL